MTGTAVSTRKYDWSDFPEETQFDHLGFRDVGRAARECCRRREIDRTVLHLVVDQPDGSSWACSMTPEWCVRKVPEDQREARLQETIKALERS